MAGIIAFCTVPSTRSGVGGSKLQLGRLGVANCRRLRSAAAANKLDAEGFENIACITSGLQTVNPGTFDSVGSTELQNAGKAGLITVQGKISAVLGTILVCAYLFITLFPDQAEKILQLIPAN